MYFTLGRVRLTTTQPQHTNRATSKKKTMISPARWLPAASIWKVSEITILRAIHLDLRNTAMQFFYVKLTIHFFY
jgi:hypothetical protein